MVRKIDDLGRVVLPAELRRVLGIRHGDELEICVDGERIILAKVEGHCTFCGSEDDLRPLRSKLVCQGCAAELVAGS